ncbi:MAG: hypothetical protein V5A13_00635 [Haloarculaceae archaeon]
MLDTTADSWYTWVGLVATSLAVGGVVAGLPTSVPPDARGVAATVDEVAASPYGEREDVSVQADAIRLGAHGLALRSDGGTAHASFALAVTPADEGRLVAVLRGVPPGEVYRTEDAFATAIREARDEAREWRPAPDRLTVRRVTWGDVDATLVG